MSILTGIVFCALAFAFIATKGADAGSKEADRYAAVCAVALICMILLMGHWIAVLLGGV